MNDKLNDNLISATKKKLPAGTNIAHFLMDILCIGKEAVYRRLRGDVPFTFAEAALISNKLGVSLDDLIGKDKRSFAVFEIPPVMPSDVLDCYYANLGNYINLFDTIRANGGQSLELTTSANVIPLSISLKYETISKFRIFKWMYQLGKLGRSGETAFNNTVIPEKILSRQHELITNSLVVDSVCYILDSNVFEYFYNDIKYFIDVNLLSAEDILALRVELMEMLDELEDVSVTGKLKIGIDCQIYTSNVNFDSTYCYLVSGDLLMSFIRIFSFCPMMSKDPLVFQSIKDWNQSLKKFSTLISQSAELHRIQFFKKQRALINSLVPQT